MAKMFATHALPSAQPHAEIPAATDLAALNRLLRTIHICECVMAEDQTGHVDALHIIERMVMQFFYHTRDTLQIVPHPTLDTGTSEPNGVLTQREIEVLQLVARNFGNQEIADKLYITEGTVKTHLANIYSKLDVTKRRHAVHEARALGLL